MGKCLNANAVYLTRFVGKIPKNLYVRDRIVTCVQWLQDKSLQIFRNEILFSPSPKKAFHTNTKLITYILEFYAQVHFLYHKWICYSSFIGSLWFSENSLVCYSSVLSLVLHWTCEYNSVLKCSMHY